LIVDDKENNRTAFEAVLERDFTVTTADGGREAIELCRKEEFAVIVLDVRMPGMDGFETSVALRSLEATRSTPIIIFTSAYEQTMVQMSRGFVAGATDFLFSPVEPELLKLKVTTYARIYLRQEALRLEVRELKQALTELHAELDRRGDLAAAAVKDRLDQVERSASALDQSTR
jgi:CheY-like chemotaxis protein